MQVRECAEPLEGLVIVAGLGGVSEGLADVAVRPLVGRLAVVGGVRNRVGALRLSRAVLGVVEVEAVADVAEQTRRRLLPPLWHAFHKPDGGETDDTGGRSDYWHNHRPLMHQKHMNETLWARTHTVDYSDSLIDNKKEKMLILYFLSSSSHPSVSSLPLNSASASFFSLIFSSSFFRCRSTITLFRKLIWWRQSGHRWEVIWTWIGLMKHLSSASWRSYLSLSELLLFPQLLQSCIACRTESESRLTKRNYRLRDSLSALIIVPSPEGGASTSSPSEACVPMSLSSRLWTRLCSWALSLSSVSTADCSVLATAFSPRSTAICSDRDNGSIPHTAVDTTTTTDVTLSSCDYLIPQNLQLPVFVWD